MKILFKNTTKYDKENRENFTNFHKSKYGLNELLKSLVLSIFIIYMLIFNIVNLNWIGALILITICVGFYLLNKLIISKNKEEKKKKQKDKEFTFFFYEKQIKIKYKREFERINYFELKKIFETDENFFLYTGEKHSLILDKEGFTIGTAKDFSEFIKKKCPLKYSRK